MHLKIAVLPGDYIGPEVMAAAIPVLESVLKKSGHTLEHSTHDVGGVGGLGDEVGDINREEI